MTCRPSRYRTQIVQRKKCETRKKQNVYDNPGICAVFLLILKVFYTSFFTSFSTSSNILSTVSATSLTSVVKPRVNSHAALTKCCWGSSGTRDTGVRARRTHTRKSVVKKCCQASLSSSRRG